MEKFNFKLLPVSILVFIFSIFALLPFYVMIVMGTYVNEDLFKGIKLFPGTYVLQNLHTVLSTNFLNFYANSLYIAILTTVGGVFISALTGFAFAKYSFRFKKILFYFILATLMIPGQLGLIGLMVEMRWFGLGNSHFPLIVPAMASAFGVFWMYQYIGSSIPNELLESSRIDGCGDFRIFSFIVLPNIKPGLVTISLLLFLGSWNNYLMPLIMLNKENLYTITLGIAMLDSLHRTDYAAKILALALSTFPILILFSIGSKSFIKGLMTGSIKG